MPKNICEDQATGALKMLGCYYHNSNSQKPEVDKIACYKGLSVRIECKYTAKDYFDANTISLAERRCLTWHERSGGLSVVMLMQVKSNTSRAWLVPWRAFIEYLWVLNGEEWIEGYFTKIRHEYSFEHEARRKRAKGKIYFDLLPDSLCPGGRNWAIEAPMLFFPVERKERRDFRGGFLGNEWDFSTFFQFHFRRWLARSAAA